MLGGPLPSRHGVKERNTGEFCWGEVSSCCLGDTPVEMSSWQWRMQVGRSEHSSKVELQLDNDQHANDD